MKKPDGLREKIQLAPFTTMKVGGPADYFVAVRSADEVRAACEWAAAENLPVFVLGEGSNIVVSDKPVHRLVIKIEIKGFEVVFEDDDTTTIKVGAGEHWDDVVKRTVDLGLEGIEAMSMIPGTAGGAPVQNAGAYGQEIADTLTELQAYDILEGKLVTLARDRCGFKYRSSKFREEWTGRFVITGVTLKLRKNGEPKATYESLKRYLNEHHIEHPTLAQVREGVMAVRARILPDPSVVPNVGSVFKNPIVSPGKLAELQAEFGDVASFKYEDAYKIGAGWIVEKCGYKGRERFGLKIWPQHALVITNPDDAGYENLMKLVDEIKAAAKDKFGIELEMEPLLVK